jgi:ribonuclease HI
MTNNPYALYVNCDGAMDYTKGNPGGIGFVINFPEAVGLDPIEISGGTYYRGNIERLEIEALIQAIRETNKVFKSLFEKLKNVNTIIFITDRLGLNDKEKTSPYKIREWRRNGWKNNEGKPIKNHKLLDELDKERLKLSRAARASVNIEWRRRKQNKKADNLAKAGKIIGLPNFKLENKSEKIGKRKFDGPEINYRQFQPKDEIHVNIFRKDPVQDQWEIWAEVCAGTNLGDKFKIYADDNLSGKLKRGNEYIIRIKEAFRFHITIFRSFKKPKNDKITIENASA